MDVFRTVAWQHARNGELVLRFSIVALARQRGWFLCQRDALLVERIGLVARAPPGAMRTQRLFATSGQQCLHVHSLVEAQPEQAGNLRKPAALVEVPLDRAKR